MPYLANVYIADFYNQRIRKVTVSTGIITTIAGTGTDSYSGDGGEATSATLNYPVGVALDTAGNVYIVDQYNFRIRKVTVSTGIITTIAGTDSDIGYSGDNGPATAAELNGPVGVAVDSAGSLRYLQQIVFFSLYSNPCSFTRQRVHCRYMERPYPQGNGLHRDYHNHRRWYWVSELLG